MTLYHHPQIKICGLTQPDEARAAVDLGADAIGLVFYPRSPRNVSLDQAAAITAVLPAHVPAVGVVVDMGLEPLVRTIKAAGLKTVQLHGAESPGFISELKESVDVRIIKALFASREPGMADAGQFGVDGYLVECGQGRLPGGNAMSWNWAEAEPFARQFPMALAGGLAPENVADAIVACLPDAVDASSSLEAAPGRKDLKKVERFIAQVRQTRELYAAREKKVAPLF